MSKKNTTQKAEPEESLRSLSDLSLQITVFICGASLMSFEIIATRFLAPSFGNSVYVWGAVISLFLGSMTIGYALGGKITERYLASTSLPLILIGAGAFILLAPAIQATVCRTFEPLGARMGTLGASLLLFAPASLLIAMVSPIAVHACVAEISKVGTTAGRIYAISAMGSIVGTLVTSFFLIPLLGVAGIAILLAASLFVCAIQTKVLTSGAQAVTPLIFLIAISGAITLGLHQTMAATGPKRVAYFAETPYHNVSVVDTFRDRQLRFDNFVESSIDLKPPYWSTCRYTDTFHLASLLNPDMKSVAFIGAGGGIGPREFKRFYPSLERIDVVDIDPVVLEVCTDYFHLEEDEVTHLHAVDGRQFVRRSDQKWDVVILDAFTIGGQIPFHLATQEYFQEISEKLTPGGVFIMNTNSALEGPLAQVYQSLHPTISKVFPHVYVYAQGYGIGIGTELTRNVIFVGVKAEEAPSIETLLDRAAQFDASHAEGRKDLLGIAEDLIPSEESADFPKGPILTDRFNPIDTYAFRGFCDMGSKALGLILMAILPTQIWAQDPLVNATDFEGRQAWFHLEQLVSFGERYTGSPGNEQAKNYMRSVFQNCQGQLRESHGTMEVEGTEPVKIENIWFQFAPEVKENRLLLGTHFDTRPWPDREEDESLHRVRGVIGACDGGSGTAILLELASVLSEKNANIPVDIVMFDAEEPLPKEFIPKGYFLGSRKFVFDRVKEGTLSQYGAVLVIDVVGGKNAQVGLDQSSIARAPRWSAKIQNAIEKLDLPSLRLPANYSIWDDHTAFQNAGVPAALMIDYDYPYLDTLKDTLDKCDPQAVKEVGQTVLQVVIDHGKSASR